MDVFFSALYNIVNIKWENSVDVYSNIVAFVWGFLLTGIFISIPLVYWCWSKKLNSDNGKLSGLFEDYKAGKKVYMLDHFIFLCRRLILACVLIFGWNHGLIQTITFLLTWLCVCVWKVIMKPFDRTILNVQEWLFEFSLIIIVSIFLRFQNKVTELSGEGVPNILGFVWLVLVIFMILINWVVTICLWKKKRTKVSARAHCKHFYLC